jgi:hypothetical protein
MVHATLITDQQSPEREPLAGSPTAWSCGCIPEVRLCSQALQLWAAASTAFTANVMEDNFRGYHAACEAFDAHYAL